MGFPFLSASYSRHFSSNAPLRRSQRSRPGRLLLPLITWGILASFSAAGYDLSFPCTKAVPVSLSVSVHSRDSPLFVLSDARRPLRCRRSPDAVASNLPKSLYALISALQERRTVPKDFCGGKRQTQTDRPRDCVLVCTTLKKTQDDTHISLRRVRRTRCMARAFLSSPSVSWQAGKLEKSSSFGVRFTEGKQPSSSFSPSTPCLSGMPLSCQTNSFLFYLVCIASRSFALSSRTSALSLFRRPSSSACCSSSWSRALASFVFSGPLAPSSSAHSHRFSSSSALLPSPYPLPSSHASPGGSSSDRCGLLSCYGSCVSSSSSHLPSSSSLLSSLLPSAYPCVVSPCGSSSPDLPPTETFPLFPPSRQFDKKRRSAEHGDSKEATAREDERQRSCEEGRLRLPKGAGPPDGNMGDRETAHKQRETQLSPDFLPERRRAMFPIVSPAQQKLLDLADQKDRSGSFFVAHIGGTQFIMEKGRFYDMNRIHQRVGGRIHLHRIICYQTPDGEFWLGRPYLENVRVTATVEKHFRGPKMYMAKARPKKWRKYFSHRQDLTRIRINEVELLRNPGEEESATVPPNFTTDNPIYAALMASKQFRKPSTVLPRMKRTFMRLASREEFPLIGEDPLMNFDPVVNRLLMDRLIAGHSELFPLLRPDKNMDT